MISFSSLWRFENGKGSIGEIRLGMCFLLGSLLTCVDILTSVLCLISVGDVGVGVGVGWGWGGGVVLVLELLVLVLIVWVLVGLCWCW